MNRRNKPSRPSDPADIARRRLEAHRREREPQNWGVSQTSLALPANVDVVAETDMAGRIVRARRQDVFEMFRKRGSLAQGAYEAVRRLEADIVALHRSEGLVMHATPRVDVSRRPSEFGDGRLRAARRIDQALAIAGPANARLLAALLEPDIVHGRPCDWRVTVERETGERLPDAQGARLRAACENLAEAYGRLDSARSRPGTRSPGSQAPDL